jgi:hypothetical protein
MPNISGAGVILLQAVGSKTRNHNSFFEKHYVKV